MGPDHACPAPRGLTPGIVRHECGQGPAGHNPNCHPAVLMSASASCGHTTSNASHPVSARTGREQMQQRTCSHGAGLTCRAAGDDNLRVIEATEHRNHAFVRLVTPITAENAATRLCCALSGPRGGVITQRCAKPFTLVQIQAWPTTPPDCQFGVHSVGCS